MVGADEDTGFKALLKDENFIVKVVRLR